MSPTFDLYDHQKKGVEFLVARPSAGLFWMMGTGKTRTVLAAAYHLAAQGKIDAIVALCPAAVRYSWNEELQKMCAGDTPDIKIISYGLLPNSRHVADLKSWCERHKTLLVCDESSFLKNRTAKTSKGALILSQACRYCWLLTGTPIANSPIDLYAQGCVMEGRGKRANKLFRSARRGPMSSINGFYHFRAKYFTMGGFKGKVPFVNEEKLPELQKLFKPFVSVLKKEDCLDLPPKSWVVREVALDKETWSVYEQLRKEALLALSDKEVKPEPNAAVRIMRLCQLTSGHVGYAAWEEIPCGSAASEDVSSEKINWLVSEIAEGEFRYEPAIIVWCRWTRERERLLASISFEKAIRNTVLCQIFGGQTSAQRDWNISMFQNSDKGRRIMLAQPHAGGYGLSLTAAKCAIYMSNDFSHVARVQSEDRCHRIGQNWPVTYVDVLATGPKGENTVDHHVVQRLREKKSLAEMTCKEWRNILRDC